MTERIAVLESQQIQNQKDLAALYKFIRDHMEKEEEQAKKQEAHNIKMTEALAELKRERAKEKGFLGGAAFVLSALWAIIFAGLTFWFKTH